MHFAVSGSKIGQQILSGQNSPHSRVPEKIPPNQIPNYTQVVVIWGVCWLLWTNFFKCFHFVSFQKKDYHCTDFKTTKSKEQVLEAFKTFTEEDRPIQVNFWVFQFLFFLPISSLSCLLCCVRSHVRVVIVVEPPSPLLGWIAPTPPSIPVPSSGPDPPYFSVGVLRKQTFKIGGKTLCTHCH